MMGYCDDPTYYTPGWNIQVYDDPEFGMWGEAYLTAIGPECTGVGECWEKTPDSTWLNSLPTTLDIPVAHPGSEVSVTCADIITASYGAYPLSDPPYDPWLTYTCEGDNYLTCADGPTSYYGGTFSWGVYDFVANQNELWEYRVNIHSNINYSNNQWGWVAAWTDEEADGTGAAAYNSSFTKTATYKRQLGCTSLVHVAWYVFNHDGSYESLGAPYVRISKSKICDLV